MEFSFQSTDKEEPTETKNTLCFFKNNTVFFTRKLEKHDLSVKINEITKRVNSLLIVENSHIILKFNGTT